MNAIPRVVTVGGGLAGLETAFTLRERLGDRVELTVVADRSDFVFRPGTVYLPFGGAEADVRVPLATPADRRGIDLRTGSLAGVDEEADRISLTDGTEIDYDYLVLATGSAPNPDEIPGLAEHAHTTSTIDQMKALGHELRRVRDAAVDGSIQHVLVLIPPGNQCAGPLYELAFMIETWLRKARVRDLVVVTFATFEETYLRAFGTGLHRVVAGEFADRGIIGCAASAVATVEPDLVKFADGTARTYDLLIAATPHRAAVSLPELPHDDRGFLLTESATRRVLGTDSIYAPGDSGDFPIKLGFLAFLQADAAADDIASRIDPDAVAHPRRFDPVGMYLMEMFDDALFTQVPLTTTGDPAHPVRVRDDATDDYLVGVSPIWRLGKKALGLYLPQQFRAGRPFHAGLPWQAMELGRKSLSKALTDTIRD